MAQVQRFEEVGCWRRFAKTFTTHREGLPAWYDFPISTGPLEGRNNELIVMKRQAYGFGDPEFFKPKILALHESLKVLVG